MTPNNPSKPSETAMRFAYADPPYPGKSKRYYAKHPDYAGEVDHAALVERLMDEFRDGWALSTNSSSLQEVLALCPVLGPSHKERVRVMAWVKPMCMTLPISVQYSWEPVLFWGGRDRRHRGYLKDYCSASPPAWKVNRESDLVGVKPLAFCHWIFEALGAEPRDELADLFPGSGAVTRAWESWCAQGVLNVV